MAKAKKSVIGNLSGKIDRLMFADYDDKQVIRKGYERKPTTQWTQPQQASQRDFAKAVAYGKRVLADPAQKAQYTPIALQKHRSEWNLAVSDARTPPEIHDVDLSRYQGESGELIALKAVDDIRIAILTVKIRTTAGTLLEEGRALWNAKADRWIYRARVTVAADEKAVTIEATAIDLPGNTAVKIVDHLLRRMS